MPYPYRDIRDWFKDEEDAAATATAIAWTLKDEDGEVVNSRENVDEGSGTSVDIYLEGADLALPDPDYPKRTVDVDFTYTNASGEHTGRIRVEFFIDNSR